MDAHHCKGCRQLWFLKDEIRRRVRTDVEANYHPITKFNGDLKAAIKAIGPRIRQLKDERSELCSYSNKHGYSRTTMALDYERYLLHFAAWVINCERDPKDGWRNSGNYFVG